MPSQDYKLFATATGEDSYIPVKADIVITNDTTKDIELTSAFKLYGYVREDGTGIKNVLVIILSNSNDYFANETTDSLGYYEFSNVPAGSDYQVTARPVDYAQKTHVDQAAGTEVNFDLSSGGPISGYVRDASFNPLSNIRVKLKSSSQDLKKTTRTDTDGYYIFNGLSKYDLSGAMIADYEITVKSSDYPKQVVSNIKVDDTVDFTLSSSDDNLISGVVTDSSGELPSSSKYVEVFIFEEDSSRKPFDRVNSGFTAIEDGVLVKIQLDVDQGFTSSDISFITSETALIDASFEQLDYSASDGVLSVKNQTSSVHSIPTLNEWGLMIFSSILLLMSIMRIKYQVKRVT
ncbi:MAG: hypothetical protein OMM_04319 [Candidatus Magnetoglobus multicellularis str. Araruama]|uniref:IPTL-CTERM protein sorting domain-containing protein n=1 Tax=Candidatus Magnetoglobus multicellularis str. Araruama TaxID=890399 RepID=A0A1V1P1Z2_9BACT|nr:MAG: hypothetical protein OMM_04319 [Candidatus Magnetoglobus multicellularis str. Araruama]